MAGRPTMPGKRVHRSGGIPTDNCRLTHTHARAQHTHIQPRHIHTQTHEATHTHIRPQRHSQTATQDVAPHASIMLTHTQCNRWPNARFTTSNPTHTTHTCAHIYRHTHLASPRLDGGACTAGQELWPLQGARVPQPHTQPGQQHVRTLAPLLQIGSEIRLPARAHTHGNATSYTHAETGWECAA